MLIDSQPAFVLHSRPYRDSSMLVELITEDYGRVSGVVKGVRGAGKTAKQRRSLIQPFIPLVIGWGGNSDLKSVTRYELQAAPVSLQGERLFSGIYINELYTRLLQHYDENPHWYWLYREALTELCGLEPVDIVLRCFELALLQELGYGVDLTQEGDSGARIVADQAYYLDADCGFVRCRQIPEKPPANLFPGADLLAIAAREFSDSARRSAKRLCRMLLASHLGDKPLKSRELFR